MLGAIIGDIIGSPYEFDAVEKTKEFPLFSENSVWTDDTVMTVAVADAFLTAGLDASEEALRQQMVKCLRHYGKLYPKAGYGLRFWKWLRSWRPKPYNSCGNGSAMRVSSAAWLYHNLESVRKAARISAEVTHNHPEGIKGAEATAAAIFLARTGYRKEEIKTYVIKEFGYDLSRTCDEIRPGYYHVEICQQTVPEAVTAFLEGEDFEDVIRTAVSLGGDCDTLTCIAGGMAEAFYGMPEEFVQKVRDRLPDDMLEVIDVFYRTIDSHKVQNTFR
jgi:ADP-ribosylglycohydrolase